VTYITHNKPVIVRSGLLSPVHLHSIVTMHANINLIKCCQNHSNNIESWVKLSPLIRLTTLPCTVNCVPVAEIC